MMLLKPGQTSGKGRNCFWLVFDIGLPPSLSKQLRFETIDNAMGSP